MSLFLMSLCNGAVTLLEELNLYSEVREGSAIPKPPNLAVSAITFLSISFGGEHPVRAGMNSNLMKFLVLGVGSRFQ